ncbi:MAG: MaoC/PaaZ C-terminal domain-containing protein [SAR202 cluster bacterium]|nr:MaoC/PaaZ C-terminal domain-containing protein [SAR202 cluster bacterium]
MADQPHDEKYAYVGKDLGSKEFLTTDAIMENYFNGLGVDHSYYSAGSVYDQKVAPTMTLTEIYGIEEARMPNNFGNLWMRQEWEMNSPILPDQKYNVTSSVLDIYEHRNRDVVLLHISLWSPDGDLISQGRHHQSFMKDQTTGTVSLRDPKAKGGVRKFNVPDGELVEGDPHTISLEMCGTFFHGNANYHTNKEAAEELGFQEVVVGGRMTMSYVGDLMDRQFGKAWYESGKMDIKFTNITWPEDTIIPKAVVTDETTENGETRSNMAVWVEKEDGTVVIVGTASIKA